jgi:hypothetical protein
MLNEALVQHILNLFFHLIFHSGGKLERTNVDRLSSRFEWYDVNTRSAR